MVQLSSCLLRAGAARRGRAGAAGQGGPQSVGRAMKDRVGGRKAARRPCLLTDLPSVGRGGAENTAAPRGGATEFGYLARLHQSCCGFLGWFGVVFCWLFVCFEHTRPRAEALLRGEPGSQVGLRPTLAYRGEKEFPYH